MAGQRGLGAGGSHTGGQQGGQQSPGVPGTIPLPGATGGRPGRGRAEIDISEARKAFILMVAFIGLIWTLQIANWADRYGFDRQYGILPRNLLRLPDIFIAPFLHANWNHIEANSGPLFVFGFLAAYRGVLRFLGVTLVVAITSGAAVWLFQGSGQLTVGASGLIFGYFGYLIARGLIDRNLVDVLISVVMGLSYFYLVTSAVPGAPQGVSWLAHLGGLIGGVAAGWVFRARRGAQAAEPALAGAGTSAGGTSAGSGTVAAPSGGRRSGDSGGASTTGEFRPSSGNPRADLHEELRKLGY